MRVTDRGCASPATPAARPAAGRPRTSRKCGRPAVQAVAGAPARARPGGRAATVACRRRQRARTPAPDDRGDGKSGVAGKRGAVRVDIGGSSVIKKKKTTKKY